MSPPTPGEVSVALIEIGRTLHDALDTESPQGDYPFVTVGGLGSSYDPRTAIVELGDSALASSIVRVLGDAGVGSTFLDPLRAIAVAETERSRLLRDVRRRDVERLRIVDYLDAFGEPGSTTPIASLSSEWALTVDDGGGGAAIAIGAGGFVDDAVVYAQLGIQRTKVHPRPDRGFGLETVSLYLVQGSPGVIPSLKATGKALETDFAGAIDPTSWSTCAASKPLFKKVAFVGPKPKLGKNAWRASVEETIDFGLGQGALPAVPPFTNRLSMSFQHDVGNSCGMIYMMDTKASPKSPMDRNWGYLWVAKRRASLKNPDPRRGGVRAGSPSVDVDLWEYRVRKELRFRDPTMAPPLAAAYVWSWATRIASTACN